MIVGVAGNLEDDLAGASPARSSMQQFDAHPIAIDPYGAYQIDDTIQRGKQNASAIRKMQETDVPDSYGRRRITDGQLRESAM